MAAAARAETPGSVSRKTEGAGAAPVTRGGGLLQGHVQGPGLGGCRGDGGSEDGTHGELRPASNDAEERRS